MRAMCWKQNGLTAVLTTHGVCGVLQSSCLLSKKWPAETLDPTVLYSTLGMGARAKLLGRKDGSMLCEPCSCINWIFSVFQSWLAEL